jgi:hypothetical protein
MSMANKPSHATVSEAPVSELAESSDSNAKLRQFGVGKRRVPYCTVINWRTVWRIRDVYPGSRIPDPKTGRKKRDEKKIFVKHFFVATNFTKCKIISFLNCSRKKFGPN